MRVKICGITNIEDALACCQYGADALGFIFYKKSKRFLNYDRAKNIIQELPFFIMKIGVFVNEDSHQVNKISHSIGLTGVQLHGDEPPDYIEKIQLPVIKSFRVQDTFDYSVLESYHNCSFLLDSFTVHELGGSGQTFHWNNIPQPIRNKIILAGGISEKNIKQVREAIKPAAVDVSSAVEDSPGKKNHTKIKNLLGLIKG